MNETTFNRLLDEVKELRRRLDESASLLHAERRMFLTMAETLTDIVFTFSPDGSWDYVNARIYETTGLLDGTALGAGWIEALHPDDLDRVKQDLHEAVTSGSPLESKFRLRDPEGTYRRFIAQAHPLCDDAGRIVRWIGTATDVDDLLKAEDELEQVNRKNQAFLAKLAHDLRNAIAPIGNSAAILRNPSANASQKQRSVEIIDRQVRDLRAYFDKLQTTTDTRTLPTETKDPSAAQLLKQSPRRILVVASDGDFVNDWSMLLGVAGHDVRAASGLQQAQDLANEFKPEVLAVSFPLFADDRDDWAKRLRKHPALAKAFIVAIAADDTAIPADCDAVLHKPVKLQQFLQLLAERAPSA